jgi:hypothetical protein
VLGGTGQGDDEGGDDGDEPAVTGERTPFVRAPVAAVREPAVRPPRAGDRDDDGDEDEVHDGTLTRSRTPPSPLSTGEKVPRWCACDACEGGDDPLACEHGDT